MAVTDAAPSIPIPADLERTFAHRLRTACATRGPGIAAAIASRVHLDCSTRVSISSTSPNHTCLRSVLTKKNRRSVRPLS